MARKIKPPDALPSKAWLMSFGDTMTTLLAFFIVLCSLAEDQTGANLHSGTGSFIEVLDSGGMNGVFAGDKTARAVNLQDTSPLYMTDAEVEVPPGGDNKGTDDESNDIPSKDREQEEFMRCLNEIERIADLDIQPSTTGETTFDFFEKLAPEAPYISSEYANIAIRIVPLLKRKTHRVQLIVWAPTPGPNARTRTSIQAGTITAEILKQAGLASKEEAKRFTGISRSWPYKDVKRPVLSLIIQRVEST